jgi:uncharacterized protein
MITDELPAKIADAMKKRDEIRLSTLRLLSASLHNAKIAKMGDLTEQEELEIVRKEAKKRQDAIEAYENVGAKDRADKERKELEILKEYLPAEMNDTDLEKIVDEAIAKVKASSPQDMGKVMAAVMPEVKGRADGKKVSALVQKKLS